MVNCALAFKVSSQELFTSLSLTISLVKTSHVAIYVNEEGQKVLSYCVLGRKHKYFSEQN